VILGAVLPARDVSEGLLWKSHESEEPRIGGPGGREILPNRRADARGLLDRAVSENRLSRSARRRGGRCWSAWRPRCARRARAGSSRFRRDENFGLSDAAKTAPDAR
jgi:hypothetical protein